MKKITGLTLLLLAASLFVGAQKTVRTTCTTETEDDHNKVFTRVEIEPRFNNGKGVLMDWIVTEMDKRRVTDSISKYIFYMPEDSAITVEICFMIEKDGSVGQLNVCCIKSTSTGYNVNIGKAKAILEGILSKMPKWKPAMQNGSVIAVERVQRISFVL
jgi:hypothetical protein